MVENNIKNGSELDRAHFQIEQLWLFTAMRENPALATSGIYLVLSMIGLAYSWRLMDLFGVNILYYADITDFLMAAMRRPVSIVAFVLTVLLFVISVQLDFFLRRHWRFYRRWSSYKRLDKLIYNPGIMVISVLLIAGLYIFNFAKREAKEIRRDSGQKVIVYMKNSSVTGKPGVEVEGKNGLRTPLLMIDATSRYVFFYNQTTKKIHITPHENIELIEPVTRK